MARKSCKGDILDALERVVARQGLAATTMEAVAAEAGVSKGGLFYHFASKKDMLLQVMERYENRWYERRAEIEAGLPAGPTRKLKAAVLASLEPPADKSHSHTNISALLDDADLRERFRTIKERLFKEVVKGSKNPEKAALTIMVTDGLWVSELFGKPVFSEAFRKRMIDELLRSIDTLGAG